MNWVMLGFLVGISITIFISLILKNKDRKSKICLDDLLLGADGRISKSICVVFGVFFVSSWAIVYRTINNTLIATELPSYCGFWVSVYMVKILNGSGVVKILKGSIKFKRKKNNNEKTD